MTVEFMVGNGIVLQQVPQFLQDTIASIVAFVPVLISAIVILLIGWIVGRLIGAVVTRIVGRIGLSEYTQGTPLESDRGGDGGLADALGTLVSYVIYFYAALAAANVLGITILSQLLSEIGQFLPVVLSAIVVLVIGFVVGRVIGGIIEEVIGGFGLENYVRDTPLAGVTRAFGGFGGIIGTLAEFYIYFLTLLAAADILQIPILSQLLNGFAGYIPTLIGGLVVLFVGALAAEFVEDVVADTDRSRLTNLIGLVVKLFIYYIAITIALDTIGFDTGVLTALFTSFVTAFFGALAVAAALAIGIGVGWGSKDYVADNIDRWMANARDSASDVADEEGSDRSGGRGGSDGFDTSDSDDRSGDSDGFDTSDSDDRPGGSGPSGTGN